MKRSRLLLSAALALFVSRGWLGAEVVVDVEQFGKSLGGWEGRKAKQVEYEMSDNRYRTFRPDISPTPDGGLFISLRIDHVRGFFASDDHASLELSVDPEGKVTATRSSISVQGKRITSDVIAGGVRGAGQSSLGLTPAETVIAVGADLVANLTEKLSRETKVEPGRVSFPAVVKHNFNLLFQAIEVKQPEPEPEPEPESSIDDVAGSAEELDSVRENPVPQSGRLFDEVDDFFLPEVEVLEPPACPPPAQPRGEPGSP